MNLKMETPPAQRSPNMKTIGAAAGVSKSTVSMALRDDPKIPATTRDRVKKIATEMGYRRNPVIDSLMYELRAMRPLAFQGTLGLINATRTPHLKKHREFAPIREAALEECRALSYGMDEFWLLEDGVKSEKLQVILETRGICGLLVVTELGCENVLNRFDQVWKRFSSVVVGVPHPGVKLDHVAIDHYKASREITSRVLREGFRPLLALTKQQDTATGGAIRAGFESAIHAFESGETILPAVCCREDHPPVGTLPKDKSSDALVYLKDGGYEVYVDRRDGSAGDKAAFGLRPNYARMGSAGIGRVADHLRNSQKGYELYPMTICIDCI